MRNRLLLAVLAACALVYCLFTFAPATRAADAGRIAGVVVNGTHDNTVVAGQTVTLQDAAQTPARDVATARTDAQGRFSFDGLDTTGTSLYTVYTTFQGGLFATQPIQPGTDASAQPTQLRVYDATTSDANISISVATVLLREPRPRNGLIGVGEFITLNNSGKTAFTGQATPTNNDPHTLLRFTLPDGAANVTLGAGFAQVQAIPVATGFAATATVPPGQTQFAFAYDVPYTDTTYDLAYSQVYKTAQVIVLAPTDMQVQPVDYASQGTTSAFDSTYQVYFANDLDALKSVHLRVVALPKAGEQGYLDFRALVVVGAALAVVIALLLLLYLRRGDLAPVLGLAARTPVRSKSAPDEAPVAEPTAAEREAERKRLLRELLRLERAHAAGKLDDATWHAREREVKQQLRAILADTDDADSADGADCAASATDAASAPQTPATERVETGGGH